eukprot:1193292-Prorocentrum_minimum.AAC.2
MLKWIISMLKWIISMLKLIIHTLSPSRRLQVVAKITPPAGVPRELSAVAVAAAETAAVAAHAPPAFDPAKTLKLGLNAPNAGGGAVCALDTDTESDEEWAEARPAQGLRECSGLARVPVADRRNYLVGWEVNITSIYGSSRANNGKGALSTPDTHSSEILPSPPAATHYNPTQHTVAEANLLRAPAGSVSASCWNHRRAGA